MNASFRGSDIDLVVIVPNYVNRTQDFFGEFHTILNCSEHVKKLIPITTALVPLITMVFMDIEVDI